MPWCNSLPWIVSEGKEAILQLTHWSIDSFIHQLELHGDLNLFALTVCLHHSSSIHSLGHLPLLLVLDRLLLRFLAVCGLRCSVQHRRNQMQYCRSTNLVIKDLHK